MKSSSSRGNVTGTLSELLDHAPAFNTLMLTRSEVEKQTIYKVSAVQICSTQYPYSTSSEQSKM